MQVASNYTWGFTSTNTCGGDTNCPSGTNKYNQHTISTNWTLTDAHLQTYVGDLVSGLNHASILPLSFVYAYWTDPTWSEFHTAIRFDTWAWDMPPAARVDPRHAGSSYYLSSWRSAPAGDYGHYILLRGYSGSSQSTATALYNDSSGGVDEHDSSIHILGNTGAFSDYSNTVWWTMKLNTSGSPPHYYFIW